MNSIAEQLASLKGKTIENITATDVNELVGGVRGITLYFTDGTTQILGAGKFDIYTSIIYVD